MKVVKVLLMKQKASCGTFSPDGSSLAVGMMSGGVKVFKVDGVIEQLAWCKTFNSAVKDLKYSPNGKYLAAASCDQFIDVYEVGSGYKRVSRCGGHSSTILHIDWSLGGDAIQANDQAYEVSASYSSFHDSISFDTTKQCITCCKVRALTGLDIKNCLKPIFYWAPIVALVHAN